MDLLQIKSLYEKGANLIDHLEHLGLTRSEAIAISYDFQAGSYVQYAEDNPGYTDDYASQIADILNGLGVNVESVMEAGVGEATTLAHVRSRLTFEPDSVGFDISLSRVLFGRRYFAQHGKGSARFFVGDMFNVPFQDNSIDIVYTSHSIEPNGGREREALSELYRVAGKYLVLLEPSYELATIDGKNRMDRLGFIKGLVEVAGELGMKVVDYKLTKICDNPLNPTAMILIEKDKNAKSFRRADYCCPQTGKPLKLSHGSYWSESSLKIYPVFFGIPCLTDKHGVVVTHYSEFI
jgi:ubiquinone/menaquinone biosynthesis C-methylase UbiE